VNPQQAYDELVQRSQEIFTIHSIESLTSWDQQVNMPPKGVTHRARMMAYLAQLGHQKSTDPRIGELLAAAEGATWPIGQAANLREWRRDYDQATRLPEALVTHRAGLITRANAIWQAARASSDFRAFAPILGEIVALCRDEADCLGWQAERYDALLDRFEPDLTTAQCDAWFAELRGAVAPLLQRIVASPLQPDKNLFRGATFPRNRQQALGRAVTAALGFDYQAGRLDASTHPFTTGPCSQDVRLTTRYNAKDPFQALMGTIHEAGHGMYGQGVRLEHEGAPLGRSASLGLHESQSRFFENNIGRSRPFWAYWFPRFKKTFGRAVHHVDSEAFYRLLNKVEPTFIRVEADEVTYNLHIMVRFEIERDLMRDDLAVADLPAVWNARYQEYLGITPPTDRDGVLQDIHWSWGLLGYFPTYSLGTVYAAQLEAALRRATPDLDAQMAAGEFGAALAWMREQIHQPGMTYRPAELIEHATGQRPAAADYIAYLTGRYTELYGDQ